MSTQPLERRRVNRETVRLAVAEGLLARAKPDLLEGSTLCELLALPRNPAVLWPRGLELATRLEHAAREVIASLERLSGYALHRSLLEGVLRGESISRWAQAHGRRREYVSRTLWRDVSLWVSQRLVPK